MFKLLVVLMLFHLASSREAVALEFHLKTTGVRRSGKCVPGVWSNANCYGSLRLAMSSMSGGDTLLIDDGIYTGRSNSIDHQAHPPKGTPGRFTVLRARHVPGADGVGENQPCRVRFDGQSGATFIDDGKYNDVQYVKFLGIKWDGVVLPDGWNHIYFKQCAFQGIYDGNNAALSMSGRNNLVEDCVMYGKGRYKVVFYDISRTGIYGNNVCRRCVARHDWAKKEDPTGDPIATFVSYLNRGSAFLNCIDIDSNLPAYWMNSPGEFDGAFSQPVDDSSSGPHSMEVRGSMVVNSAMGVGWGASPGSGVSSANNTFVDVAGIRVAGGINLRGGGRVQRLTLLDVGTNNFRYRSVDQRKQVLQGDQGVDSWGNLVEVADSVFRGISGAPLKGRVEGDHVATFLTGNEGNRPSNWLRTDPLRNGLKYPIRVEDGSPLYRAGEGGRQAGAMIVKRLGRDGTFKGEADWDTEQGALWPWHLEGWVQAEMRTADYPRFCGDFAGSPRACPAGYAHDAFRGFAADGQTLTRYIWQYFGNPVPANLYPREKK